MNELIFRSYIHEIAVLRQRKNVLEENVFRNAMAWVRNKGTTGKQMIMRFFINLKAHLSESKMGLYLLQKMALGHDLTPDESGFLRQHIKDTGLGVIMLGIFALPGGGIAAPALVRAANRFGVDLMPSSFRQGRKELEVIA